MTDTVALAGENSSVLHDCDLAGCRYGHRYYRYFSVDPSDPAPLAAPYVSLETGRHMGWPVGISIAGQCLVSSKDVGHVVPVVGCSCGIRVAAETATLASKLLAEYRLRESVSDAALASFGGRFDATFLDRIAFVGVGVRGRLVEGSQEDPRGIYRVSEAMIAGPIVVPATLRDHVERLAEIYSVPVEVRTTRGVAFVASFLPAKARRACQACGSSQRATNGLCVSRALCGTRVLRRLKGGGRL